METRGKPLPERKVRAVERRLIAKEPPAKVSKSLGVSVTKVYEIRRRLKSMGVLA